MDDLCNLMVNLHIYIRYECDILIHLLRSQLDMQHWRFLPSLVHLHDAHSKLNSWHSAIQPKEVSPLFVYTEFESAEKVEDVGFQIVQYMAL